VIKPGKKLKGGKKSVLVEKVVDTLMGVLHTIAKHYAIQTALGTWLSAVH
jgi:hypothetical protein